MSSCRHGGAVRRLSVAVALLGLVLSAGVAEAQSSDLPSWADSFAVVTPGAKYAKSGSGRRSPGGTIAISGPSRSGCPC